MFSKLTFFTKQLVTNLLPSQAMSGLVKQHRLANFMVISHLRPFTSDKSLNCQEETRGGELYVIRKLGITWQLPGLYFSLLVVWYLLIWIKDGSYIIPALSGAACYLFLLYNPAGSYALFNTLLNAKTMQQYIRGASRLEKRIVDSLPLKIGIFLAYALFLYTAWFYYFPPHHPLYVCFLIVRLVIFPYLLLTWLFKAAESARAPTPEAFLLGEAGDYAKEMMRTPKGGMSAVGAAIGATALLGGLAYHSQQQTVDGLRYSIEKSEEKVYSHLNTIRGSNDLEIAKRVEQLMERSKEFSDTTGRLTSDTSATSLLPKNVEFLRAYAEKGHKLRDEATQLVLDQCKLETERATLTSQPMSKVLQDARPPVSPGSPLENISSDGSTPLTQEIISPLLAKLAKISFPF